MTLWATLLGSVGAGPGLLLAVGIVHDRAMDPSVMPWAIASQTIPILAIAPMIIVVLNSIGVKGLVPKAIISVYLSFFRWRSAWRRACAAPTRCSSTCCAPGTRAGAPDALEAALAGALPYLFLAEGGVAASLVGAIVGELPTGAGAGLGARLLSGSLCGQTVRSGRLCLLAAVARGAWLVGRDRAEAQRIVLRRCMGMAIGSGAGSFRYALALSDWAAGPRLSD